MLPLIMFSLVLSSEAWSQGTTPGSESTQPVVTHVALIKTSLGDIEIELYGKDAPLTVANFVGLANANFYNGILFHRIVPGFVVQVGDPKTKDTTLRAQWGQGGSSIYEGKEFKDELDPNTPSSKRGYVEGVLAMANRGPNTNTSQFFIVSGARAKSLPHSYTIFGYVRAGMDVVKAMEKVPLTNSTPIDPISILSVFANEGTSLTTK